MRAIAKWALWQRCWSTMWWVVGILAYVALVLAFYPPFRTQGAHLDQTVISHIPAGTRAFVSDTQNWFTPIGYLSSQLYYLVLPMLLSILTIGLGSSLIAREEQDRTIELLLSRPLSRLKLLAGKVLAGGLIVTLVGIVGFASTFVLARIVHLAVDIEALLMATLSCLMLAIAFGSIAFMVTMFGRARRASIGIATLIAIGGYIVNSLAATATALKWPAKFMPFHYYQPSDLLTGKYHYQDFVVSLGIIITCLVTSAIAFHRRDIG